MLPNQNAIDYKTTVHMHLSDSQFSICTVNCMGEVSRVNMGDTCVND